MAIVKEYIDGRGIHIYIHDDAYAGKTEEELRRVYENANRIAWGIAVRHEERRLAGRA